MTRKELLLSDFIAFLIGKDFEGKALKTNEFLDFAVVTGCLRIARESIFTGTNNFLSNSVFKTEYSDF